MDLAVRLQVAQPMFTLALVDQAVAPMLYTAHQDQDMDQ
jgi:hypothetical protein